MPPEALSLIAASFAAGHSRSAFTLLCEYIKQLETRLAVLEVELAETKKLASRPVYAIARIPKGD